MIMKMPSNPNHSLTLGFYDLDIFLLSQLAEIKLHVQELLGGEIVMVWLVRRATHGQRGGINFVFLGNKAEKYTKIFGANHFIRHNCLGLYFRTSGTKFLLN